MSRQHSGIIFCIQWHHWQREPTGGITHRAGEALVRSPADTGARTQTHTHRQNTHTHSFCCTFTIPNQQLADNLKQLNIKSYVGSANWKFTPNLLFHLKAFKGGCLEKKKKRITFLTRVVVKPQTISSSVYLCVNDGAKPRGMPQTETLIDRWSKCFQNKPMCNCFLRE